MTINKIHKTDEEWQQLLSPLAYEITRCAATEPAFSGQFYRHDVPGIYQCICCQTPLFTSDAKFHSACGWPSYSKAIHPQSVQERTDNSHGMTRTEILCHTCDAHLGHVFPDKASSTGVRYCINSAALSFIASAI